MAGTQNSGTAELQVPNASSHLLESQRSSLIYGVSRERSVTPVESIIREPWYEKLQSTIEEQCRTIRDFCAGAWLAFRGGRLEAILRCLCFPCLVFTRSLANSGRRSHFMQQNGIIYLYFFLSVTVVVNLVVALKNIHYSMGEDIRNYFVTISSIIAIAFMLYLFLFTYGTVDFRRSHETLLRVFYQGGSYLFGFASFGFSVCAVFDYVACGHALDAVTTLMKALFTVLQTLFLHYFHEAIFPEDTNALNTVLAHLLGTNLALWFWTLCSEEADQTLKNCTDYPIPIDGAERYFSPLFVEYLLLSASLFYQIWQNSTCSVSFLGRTVESSQMATENTNNTTSNGNTITGVNDRDGRQFSFGVFVGAFFATLFVVLVLMSFENGANHQDLHTAYSIGTIIMYLTQFFACYIIQLSLQSHQRNRKRKSIDHDDILLYISLVGAVLWESFHAYTLIMGSLNGGSEVVDFVSDIVAIVQHLFQTTALVKLRRHERTQGQASGWICQCVLFLLVTNLTFWVQDSFLIEVAITTPGERYKKMQYELKPVGYVIHPLSIFFRFHSAICCIIAWPSFKTEG